MKNAFLFITLCLSICFITSCAKEEVKYEIDNTDLDLRNSDDDDGTTCCDYELDYEVISSDDLCCTYKITYTNTSNCVQSLLGLRLRGGGQVSPGQTVVSTVKVCKDPRTNAHSIKKIKIIHNGIFTSNLCDEVELSSDCSSLVTDCCDDVSISYQNMGGTIECCDYLVSVSNQSDCEMSLYTSSSIEANIAPFTQQDINVTICNTNGMNTTLFVGPSADISAACQSIVLAVGECKI